MCACEKSESKSTREKAPTFTDTCRNDESTANDNSKRKGEHSRSKREKAAEEEAGRQVSAIT